MILSFLNTLFDGIHRHFGRLTQKHQTVGLDYYYDLELEELKEKAAAQDPQAQFVLGDNYDQGVYVAQDLKKARALYTDAAAKDQADAINNLGSIYQHGDGVERDSAKARSYYEQGVKLKNAVSQYNLARLLEAGEGGQKDTGKALRLMKQAVKSNFAEALVTLGYWYDTGICVSENPYKAVYWYRKAARAGSGKGYFNLGCAYAAGTGVLRSSKKAYREFYEGAVYGHPGSMFNVALYNELGEGTKTDLVAAWKWYHDAHRAGELEAQKKVTHVEAELSTYIDVAFMQKTLEDTARNKDSLVTCLIPIWDKYPEDYSEAKLARSFLWALLEEYSLQRKISFYRKDVDTRFPVSFLDAVANIHTTYIESV
jgi:TPR repeat protein